MNSFIAKEELAILMERYFEPFYAACAKEEAHMKWPMKWPEDYPVGNDVRVVMPFRLAHPPVPLPCDAEEETLP